MRLIDADALIKKCGDWYTEEGPEEGFIGTIEMLVNEQPDIEPKQEWVPVSKRLPERQGYYICTCKDGPICRRTTTIKWSNGWQLSGRRAFWTVAAWMPLPEPWEGADDE